MWKNFQKQRGWSNIGYWVPGIPSALLAKTVLLETASRTGWIFNFVNHGIPGVSHALLAGPRCLSWWHTFLEEELCIVTLAMLPGGGGPSAFVVGMGQHQRTGTYSLRVSLISCCLVDVFHVERSLLTSGRVLCVQSWEHLQKGFLLSLQRAVAGCQFTT